MLYTRKGDQGTTKVIGSCERFSKANPLAEALGTVDELNSLLGLVKVKAKEACLATAAGRKLAEIISEVQQNLFIVQAELAGAESKTISDEKVKQLEVIIDGIETELPPIKSFFVSGGTPTAAFCDFARTVARRAERRVTSATDANLAKLGEHTRAYLNRLSSLLYALARLANHKSGITEESPHYK